MKRILSLALIMAIVATTYARTLNLDSYPEKYSSNIESNLPDITPAQAPCVLSISCPADVIVELSQARDPWYTGVATASCPEATITYSDDVSGLTGCNRTGLVVRTWTATTPTESVTCDQNITISDSESPTVSCPADVAQPADPGNCSTAVSFYAPQKGEDNQHFEGFEDPNFTSGDYTTLPFRGWNDYTSPINRVLSGTHGIISSSGGAHAEIDAASSPFSTGAFSRLGDYTTTFGDGFISRLDVYMDLSDPAVTANTYGWDLSTAASTPTGGHRRDFIFHTASDASGNILVGGSNNTNFTRRNDLAAINHHTITSSGWFTFEWVFRDNGAGILAVDLNLKDNSGNILWTETRSDASDVIGATVGGNLYMWFTFIVTGMLAIDNTELVRCVPVTCSASSGSIFPSGTTTITCTATDACGNQGSCTFDVTVTDDEDPVAVCQDITVTLDGSGNAVITGNDVDGGSTDNCGIQSLAVSPTSFSCGDIGNDISAIAYQTTTTSGNQSWQGELGMDFDVISAITIDALGAFDHNQDGISGTQSGGVRVAIFDRNTMVIVPGLDVTISGSGDPLVNGHRLHSIASILLPPGNYSVIAKGYNSGELNGNTYGSASSGTLDDGNGAISFVGNARYGSNTPAGFGYPLTIDGGPVNRYTAGTFGFSRPGNAVTLTVTDGSGNTSSCQATVIVEDHENPVITCPVDVTIEKRNAYDPWISGMATATDNCSATVSYSDDASGLTGCNGTGTVLRTWIATDQSGNTDTCIQTITIQDTEAPAMTCGPDITDTADANSCSTDVSFAESAAFDVQHFEGFEDPNFQSGDASTVLYRGWNDYQSSVNRVVSGTNGIPSSSGSAHAEVDATATPAGGFTGAFSRLGGYSSVFGTGFIVHQDIYMNLSDPSVGTNTYGWDLTAAASRQDGNHLRDFIFHTAANASGNILVGGSNNTNFTRRNDLAAINHYEITTSGWYTFEWVFRDNGSGQLAVDLNLKDDSGNILWTETRSNPSDVIATTVGGNRYLWFTFLETDMLAIDNTELTRNVAVSCNASSGSPFPVGTTSVTCSATDACGNQGNCSFNITVVDDENPVAVCKDITVYLDASGNVSISGADIDGGSIDNCGIQGRSASPATLGCGDLGTNLVTLTVTDNSGNTDTCTATVTVVDDESPVISGCPTDMEYCGPQNVYWTPPTVTDNCSAILTSSHNPGDYFTVGTHMVTYVATDSSGNTDTCTFTITVHELPAVSISESPVAGFCQGYVVLTADVSNEGNLEAPLSYLWSNGATTKSTTAMANGAYSVTVTDNRGCYNSATDTVNMDPSTVLSAYVILAEKEAHLDETTVDGGGVGVMGAGKKAKLHHSTTVNTFVKADDIDIDGTSYAASTYPGQASVILPPFKYGSPGSTDITVNDNQTVTISGTAYDKIEVKKDATLIVNTTLLHAKEIKTKDRATIIFNYDDTEVMLEKKMDLDDDNDINPTQKKVTFYIEDDLKIEEGGNFTGNVYAEKKIEAKKAKVGNPTHMYGQFISLDKVDSDDFVFWNWMNLCDPNAAPGPMAKTAPKEDGGAEAMPQTDPQSGIAMLLFPNPADHTAHIRWTMDVSGDVIIRAFDAKGALVSTIYEGYAETGIPQQTTIDAAKLASGVYFIRLDAASGNKTMRLVISR